MTDQLPTPAEQPEDLASTPVTAEPTRLDRPRRPRPPLVPPWIKIATATVVAALVLAGIVFGYSAAIAKVSVPNITGIELGVARARLAQQRLGVNVIERRFSPKPADTVLEQSPAQGSTLDRGQSVNVVVSAGTEDFAMPDVVGDGLLLARGILEAKGLEVRIETQPSEQPSDTVLITSPAAGTRVSTGDVVRITVATTGPGSSTLLPLDLQGVVIKIDAAPVPAGQPDVTLEIARRLRSLIEASGGAVRETRTLTTPATATVGPARAKRAKEGTATAALGLSVASTGGNAVVSFAPALGKPEIVVPSTALAAQVTTSVVAAGLKARASTTTSDIVLAVAGVPWSRVQLGAWSSRADVANFRDPAWADSIARALYRAIADLYGSKATKQ